jgi:hypothetical protein
MRTSIGLPEMPASAGSCTIRVRWMPLLSACCRGVLSADGSWTDVCDYRDLAPRPFRPGLDVDVPAT